MSIVEKHPEVQWEIIKEVWSTGVGSLGQAAADNNIPLSAILLAAKEEKWEDRGSPWADVKPREVETSTSVNKNHKQQLSVIRELTVILMKQLQFQDGIAERTKVLEKISTILTRTIALERQIYGLDTTSDGAPDKISIFLAV